jgi:enoyl-CoA hydratase/carnithine racemase
MSEPSEPGIASGVRDGAFRITIDRPAETGNRFDYATMTAWIAALEAAHASGAAVLAVDATGPDFSLGRDQSERIPGLGRRESLSLILRANDLLAGFPGIKIGLVQGRALGFGSGIALHCDITLAADDAVLGFDEIAHGLAPLVVVEYLGRHVGPKVALELVATGRDVPAQEALRLRMVNRVVPAGDLAAAGDALLAQLTAADSGALRLIGRYGAALAAGELEDPRPDAVEWLAAWIDEGKPPAPLHAEP